MKLTVEIVLTALEGNDEAILFILRCYEAYANSFAYEEYQDEYGNIESLVVA